MFDKRASDNFQLSSLLLENIRLDFNTFIICYAEGQVGNFTPPNSTYLHMVYNYVGLSRDRDIPSAVLSGLWSSKKTHPSCNAMHIPALRCAPFLIWFHTI